MTQSPGDAAGSSPWVVGHDWIASCALALLAAAAFVPALPGGFLFDDWSLIVVRSAVHDLGAVAEWFSTDMAPSSESRLRFYRPLVVASFAFDWWLSGGNPFVFHVTNLALHAGVTVAVAFAVARWLGVAPRRTAIVAAVALFAVHPAKAENVAWISGRMDVLCLAFVLIAVWGVSRRLAQRRFGLALEALGVVGAYASKETAIVLPLFVAVEVWASVGRPSITFRSFRPALPTLAMHAGFAGAYLVARAIWLPLGSPGLKLEGIDTVGGRVALVLESLGHAAIVTFAPHDLSIQRGLIEADAARHIVLHTGLITTGAVLVAVCVGAFVWLRRRAPGVAIGIAGYLASLLPTANIVVSGMTTLFSERYLYVPTVFLTLALAGALLRVRRPQLAAASVAVIAVAALGASVARAGHFADARDFWAHERSVSFGSPRVHHQVALLRIEDGDLRGAFDEIVIANDHAARAFPYDPVRLELVVDGTLLYARLTPDLDDATLERVDRVLRALSTQGPALVVAEIGRLRFRIAPGAPHLASRLEALRPHLIGARAHIASRRGRDAEALKLAAAAAKSCGECPRALFDRARAEAASGDYTRALATLDAAAAAPGSANLRRDIERARSLAAGASSPSEAVATHARASALVALGLYGRAYRHLAPHEQRFADNPGVAIGFADLACRAGDRATAERLARRHLGESEVARLLSPCRRRAD